MKCPKCESHSGRVLETVQKSDATRRRRECLACGTRFTTTEKHATVEYDATKLQELAAKRGTAIEPDVLDAIVAVDKRKREIAAQRRALAARERALAMEAGLSDRWDEYEPIDAWKELEGY